MIWHSLVARLVSSFLLVALAPLGIVGIWTYIDLQDSLQREIMDRLRIRAEDCAEKLEDYLSDRSHAVAQLAVSPAVGSSLQRLEKAITQHGIASPEYATADAEIRPYLTSWLNTDNSHDLLLLSRDAVAVFSVARGKDRGSNFRTGPYRNTGLAMAFRNAITLLETEISDFDVYEPSQGAICGFVAAPVLRDGVVIGAVVLHIDMLEIERIVKDSRGLGETGATLVAARVGDEVAFMAPGSAGPGKTFGPKLHLGSDWATAMQHAVKGGHGYGMAKDYHGREVLAVWRYLPGYRWGIVTKIDAAGVFAPLHRMRNQHVGFGLVLVVAVVSAAVAISLGIARPISVLKEAAQRITAGDFAYRAAVHGRDEVADLGAAFNEMADKMVERTGQLTNALRESDEFAYAAAHNLRSPLRGIDGFCQVVLEEDGERLSQEGRQHLDRVRQAAQTMAGLIEALLKLSRLNRKKLDRQPTDLSALARLIAEKLRRRDPERQVEFVIPDGLVAECDGPLAQALLEELLENAWKFTTPHPHTRIEVGSVRKTDRMLVFFVRDDGVGFDMAYADKLFVPFQHLHTPGEFPGTGIGLATVQRIVRRHGGRVWAEGAIGGGATFYFTLSLLGGSDHV